MIYLLDISYKVIMSPKEQLIYLLENYHKNDYTTDVFCEEFHRIYNFEVDDCDLTKREATLLSELATLTSRYSANEDDLKIPNLYFGEKVVREKAISIYIDLFAKR